jgi:lipopolysaccharide transport system permease protein
MENNENLQFETVIRPKNRWFDLKIGELLKYRDLVIMFVRRNYSTLYKQTILGPAWIIITEIVTTVIYTVIFGNIADIGTDGVPTFLFYLAGNTVWAFFSKCFINTSNTFTSNAGIFGKVYFPRLVMPISVVITQLIAFFIQFVMFIGFLVYYVQKGSVRPDYASLPLFFALLIIMGVMSLGFGIITSSLTTKYRDLTVLLTFGITVWMYITPIVYPMSLVPDRWRIVFLLNPMSSVVEAFRSIFLGVGEINAAYLCYSAGVALFAFLLGAVLFNKVEKTFMDTV